MLQNLKKYTNLGTPAYFVELLQLFLAIKKWKYSDLISHFYNRQIDSRNVFDGGVELLLQLGILIQTGEYLHVTGEAQFFLQIIDTEKFKEALVRVIFQNTELRMDLLPIFSPNYVSYNIVESKLELSNDAFDFKYASFKQLLIDLSVLIPNKDNPYKFLINPAYQSIIGNSNIIIEAQKKITLEELKNQLDLNQSYGEDAENFVLEFEAKRLGGSKNIIQISHYDVSAGFDILSYNSIDSIIHDRFIEVKSFSGQESFYWSRNEMDTAKVKGDTYQLYLIDRKKYRENNYSPKIIQNPNVTILESDEWLREIDKYFIRKI